MCAYWFKMKSFFGIFFVLITVNVVFSRTAIQEEPPILVEDPVEPVEPVDPVDPICGEHSHIVYNVTFCGLYGTTCGWPKYGCDDLPDAPMQTMCLCDEEYCLGYSGCEKPSSDPFAEK